MVRVRGQRQVLGGSDKDTGMVITRVVFKVRVWIKAALYRVTRWGTGSGSARVMAMCSIGVTELRGNMK